MEEPTRERSKAVELRWARLTMVVGRWPTGPNRSHICLVGSLMPHMSNIGDRPCPKSVKLITWAPFGPIGPELAF